MQNYDLHGVRTPHWDYRHQESLHDLPDMESFMKEKAKDIIWDLERVVAEDDEEGRLSNAISAVNDLVSDVPDELKAFNEQHNAREAMVADMTYSALHVTRSIDSIMDVIKASSSTDPLVVKITEMLEDARAECDDIFCTTSQRLHSILMTYGWSDPERSYVKMLLGDEFDPFLTIDSQASTSPSNITMSYNSTLMFDGGSELDFYIHDYAITISVQGIIRVKHETKTTTHKLWDLMEHFVDINNPTQPELAVYTMATDKEWDIFNWLKPLKLQLKIES